MLFEIVDKKGRKIRLTKTGFKHISTDHPDVSIEDVKRAVELPTTITTSTYDDNVKWYYRFDKDLREYLFVAVKYLNGEAFIITAYYTKHIQ